MAETVPDRPGGDMTATQIAARNRRARLELAAATAGGPFDPSDLDEPVDETPPLPLDANRASLSPDVPPPLVDLERVQAELRARVDGIADSAASAPTPGADRYLPADHPRVVDGLVVPAQSIADSTTATWVLVPVGEVASIGYTARAVGFSPRGPGRWLAVWIGDDRDERATVLAQFAADVAHARRLYR